MSDTMPTGVDTPVVGALALTVALSDDDVLRLHTFTRELQAAAMDRAASIAERMGLDAESDEARRLAVEIGAAIRAEV